MASAGWDSPVVQGCNEGGDGPDPDDDKEYATDDRMGDTIPPADCADPNNTEWQKLYCRSFLPNSQQTTNTQRALDRIAERGPECALIAQKGRELLASGDIRFFVWQEGDPGGYGHRNSGVQIDVDLVNHWDPVGNPYGGYEKMLVHEIDHVLGYDHLDATKTSTPHTALCG